MFALRKRSLFPLRKRSLISTHAYGRNIVDVYEYASDAVQKATTSRDAACLKRDQAVEEEYELGEAITDDPCDAEIQAIRNAEAIRVNADRYLRVTNGELDKLTKSLEEVVQSAKQIATRQFLI